MTNTQLYLAFGLPMLVVITSLVINLVTISGIRTEMGDLRSDVRGDLNEIRSDIREIRADIKLITGKLAEMDTRISDRRTTKDLNQERRRSECDA